MLGLIWTAIKSSKLLALTVLAPLVAIAVGSLSIAVTEIARGNYDSNLLLSCAATTFIILLSVTLAVQMIQKFRLSHPTVVVKPVKINGQYQDPILLTTGLMSLLWGVISALIILVIGVEYKFPLAIMVLPTMACLVPLSRGLRIVSRVIKGIPLN